MASCQGSLGRLHRLSHPREMKELRPLHWLLVIDDPLVIDVAPPHYTGLTKVALLEVQTHDSPFHPGILQLENLSNFDPCDSVIMDRPTPATKVDLSG